MESPNLLALEAHNAFPFPPKLADAWVVNNIGELLQSYSVADLREVFLWAKTPGQWKPRNAKSLTEPAKFQMWLAEAKKQSQPVRRGRDMTAAIYG